MEKKKLPTKQGFAAALNNPLGKKEFPKKRDFVTALRKLRAEAKKNGRTLPEQISIYSEKKQNRSARSETSESLLPPQILRQIIYTSAEKSRLTPGQHLKKVLRPGIEGDAPKELQNWYSQLYGEFSKGSLSEVMREVLLYGADRDDRLMLRVRDAILKGDIRYLDQITRCVALVHGIKHEGNGHASRLANLTQRNIGLAYLRLYELENKPPTAREIHVLLARDACFEKTKRLPRFTDIWYLLRSGPTDDSQNKPSREARYEITGTKNIKKIIGSFKWPLARSVDGPLNVTGVKRILESAQLKYVDDSKTVIEN